MKKIIALVLSLTLMFTLVACGGNDNKDKKENVAISQEEVKKEVEKKPETSSEAISTNADTAGEGASEVAASEDSATTESNDEATSEESGTSTTEALVDGMRPEFKEAMDSYEAFYDEYCEFMKKYKENPSDLTLLAQYTEMLTKQTEMTKKFEEWDNGTMNDAELKYYLEVSTRIQQKLLEVAQ